VILTFGKKYSLSRLCRSLYQRSRDLLRHTIRRFGQQTLTQGRECEQSLFRCFSLSEIESSFQPEWRLISRFNIAFGSGMLGSASVAVSGAMERLFLHHDPLRLALTSLIIVRRQ